MEDREEKSVTFLKNADKTLNRVIIPKFFIDKYGRSFYMKVYDNYIKLIPVDKGGK